MLPTWIAAFGYDRLLLGVAWRHRSIATIEAANR